MCITEIDVTVRCLMEFEILLSFRVILRIKISTKNIRIKISTKNIRIKISTKNTKIKISTKNIKIKIRRKRKTRSTRRRMVASPRLPAIR